MIASKSLEKDDKIPKSGFLIKHIHNIDMRLEIV